MVGMNKVYIWESVMPTWVTIDYPLSHKKLILRSCISHTIVIIAMAIYTRTCDKYFRMASKWQHFLGV